MRYFLTFLVFSCVLGVNAQKFTVYKTTQPFYDIIEWKGMGGLLLSKDPSGNSNQIYLTLVGEQTKSSWEQRFAPLDGKYTYIASENARYVYFLRSLQPDAGKIYFDQLNSAGNIKNTSVSYVSVIKNLGFDPYSLELVNVVVTDKALVHHFRYFDKKEKTHTDIATFITHHNMLIYATVLGKIHDDELKANRSHHIQYAGFTGDEICFSGYSETKNGKGWNAVVYNSKGQELKRFLIKNTLGSTTAFPTSGFGTNGAYYLNSQNTTQNGFITFHNGKYYVTTLNTTAIPQLELHVLADEKLTLVNKFEIAKNALKKPLNIGVYPVNEALIYRLSASELGDKTVALFTNGSQPFLSDYSNLVVYNISRALMPTPPSTFVATLAQYNLFFDRTQLKTATDMEFELKQK